MTAPTQLNSTQLAVLTTTSKAERRRRSGDLDPRPTLVNIAPATMYDVQSSRYAAVGQIERPAYWPALALIRGKAPDGILITAFVSPHAGRAPLRRSPCRASGVARCGERATLWRARSPAAAADAATDRRQCQKYRNQ